MSKIADLEEKNAWQAKKLEELAASLASRDNTIKWLSSSKDTAEKELEEMHGFLDGIPLALPRKDVPSERCSFPKDRSLLVRLAAWLGALKVG